MIAKLLKIKALVISISGMGYIFTDTKKIRIIIFRELYKKLLLFILSHENFRLIVQNADDKEIFTKQLHVPNEQISLIEGSGIELNNFKNIDFAKKDNLVVMPSRLLYSKGIKEYVAAASTLKKNILIGIFVWPDQLNMIVLMLFIFQKLSNGKEQIMLLFLDL